MKKNVPHEKSKSPGHMSHGYGVKIYTTRMGHASENIVIKVGLEPSKPLGPWEKESTKLVYNDTCTKQDMFVINNPHHTWLHPKIKTSKDNKSS